MITFQLSLNRPNLLVYKVHIENKLWPFVVIFGGRVFIAASHLTKSVNPIQYWSAQRD